MRPGYKCPGFPDSIVSSGSPMSYSKYSLLLKNRFLPLKEVSSIQPKDLSWEMYLLTCRSEIWRKEAIYLLDM